jgi:hypothetical protein
VACIVAYDSYRKATRATIRSNETRAALLAKLILEHERAAIGVLRSYGSRPLLVDSVKKKDFEGAVRHLSDLLKNNPEAEGPFIANPDSTVWVNFPVDKRVFNKDLSYRDWYKGVSREWKPYISSVFKLIVGEQDLTVAVSVPIFDEKGKVIGILSTAQSTAFFRKIIDECATRGVYSVKLSWRGEPLLNPHIVDMVRYAKEKGITPSQLALAWVLAQGDDMVPIPGTKRRTYLEENVGATKVHLTKSDLARIEEVAPKGFASGNRYHDMSNVNV